MRHRESPRDWRTLREAVTARLGDATLALRLVAASFDTTPAMVRARGDTPVAAVDAARVLHGAERLRAGEPLAYVVGHAPFRGLDLVVDARVLIPRPETETVVAHALAACAARPGGVAADVATGSGAIALALAEEGRFERVIATDVSRDALDVAAENVRRCAPRLRAPVELRAGSLLAPLAGERLRLLVANPPYIAPAEMTALPASVRDWEPPSALVSGDGGLAHTRAIVAGAPALLEPGGTLVLELDARRAAESAALVHAADGWAEVAVYDDLFGRPRVLVARRADRPRADD